MNRVSLMLVNAAVLSLIGCGGGDSPQDSTEGSTSGSIATAAGTASATAGLSTTGPTAGVTADNTAGGTEPQGGNPGKVPDPILGEVTSIDLSSAQGPAGYKLFSGDAVDPETSAAFANIVENSYVNLAFGCNGALDHIEVVPRQGETGLTEEPYGGTISWTPADPQDEFGVVDVALDTITYGANSNEGLEYVIDNVVNGSLMVGSGLIEDLVVTRIVQFASCN